MRGFLWFVQIAARRAEPPPPHADGIVALTGGAGRVELALHLLAEDQRRSAAAERHRRGNGADDAGAAAGVDTAALAARITLGPRGRLDPRQRGGDGELGAQNRIRSLIVVTAGLAHAAGHWRNCADALPDVRLYPRCRWQPQAGSDADHAPGVKLAMAEEFTKYLLAVSGLSALAAAPRGADAPRAGSGVRR